MITSTEIQKGDIVRYIGQDESLKDRWFRVTRCTKKTINLGSVFGSTIYAKGITKSSVIEDQDRFYARWSKSDAYRQM